MSEGSERQQKDKRSNEEEEAMWWRRAGTPTASTAGACGACLVHHHASGRSFYSFSCNPSSELRMSFKLDWSPDESCVNKHLLLPFLLQERTGMERIETCGKRKTRVCSGRLGGPMTSSRPALSLAVTDIFHLMSGLKKARI